jgi:phosphoserine phosphatase
VTGRIFLIRHGESEWNAARRYTGLQDVPLNSLGRQQAICLADRLEHEPIAAIYSSPLRRAHQTAAALADRKGLPVNLDDRLREICHGAWEGLTPTQVENQFAEEYERWRSLPERALMPQGESLRDLLARVQAFRRDYEPHDGAVAIYSHDAVLRVLTLSMLGLGLEHFWKFSFENGSITKMDARDSGFYLTTLNETAHLNGARSDLELQAL